MRLDKGGSNDDKLVLSNGLTVRFKDLSRRVAGDRWYVGFEVEIPVEVKLKYFAGEDDPQRAYQEFIQHVGPVYVFTYKKERNFIDEKEVNKVWQTMKKDFLDANLAYLQIERFPEMCIRKAYRDWKEEQRWRVLHEQAVHQADSEQS